jgi:predicted transposase YbfD/YdcC
MESSTFLKDLPLPTSTLAIEPTSLYAALSRITDPRKRRGRRYHIALVLPLIILGKLAGETTLSGIAQWARLRADWLCHVFQLPRTQLPCANTYTLVSANLDLDELHSILGQYFASLAPPAPAPPNPSSKWRHHLALDGKTLRGTRRRGQPRQAAIHLLGLYDVTARTMLAQQQVATKDHEVPCAAQMLAGQDLRGCVLSADALHTQRAWCTQVRRQGGDYVLIAKKNQPALRQDLVFFFEGDWPAYLEQRRAETVNKAHGRLEVRRICLSSELQEFLSTQWAGVEQVFQIEREITRHGQTVHERVYGITSLTAQAAGPERVLTLVRDHWHIENRVHWRRDVTLGEDASRVRYGQAPQVIALLNNVVLALMDRLGVRNLPAKMREFAAYPAVALALLIRTPDF